MSKEVKTYPDLLAAIGQDLKPRLQLTLHITESDSDVEEAIYSALHSGPILALIAEFVGYRHVELKGEEQKEQEKKSEANELIVQRLRSFFDGPNFVQADLTRDAFYKILHASTLEANGHQEQGRHAEMDKKRAIWQTRLRARIKDLEKELRDLRKEQQR